jgi:sugar lactone lactonase YvrE
VAIEFDCLNTMSIGRSMRASAQTIRTCSIPRFLLYVICIPLSAFAAAEAAPFKSKPEIKALPIGAKITFELSKPADVEIAVLDAQGRVIRHLAAGVLGGELAPPEPLEKGLQQSIKWDGRDDAGKSADKGPFTVRIRTGLQSKLGGIIGSPASLSGKVYGLATDDSGNLYVGSGAVYSSEPVFSIRVFDSHGKYVRMILPMQADLTAKQTAEFGAGRNAEGHLQPTNFNALVPYVQDGGIATFIGNRIRAGQIWLLNTNGHICRIRADNGAAVAWASAPKTTIPSGGPMCWAVSPDGSSLYFTGWWNARQKEGVRDDGVLWSVDPASGKTTELLKIDAPADSPWLIEQNGWYHFKNWDRKNGLAALHGLAVDRRGRLHVCDRVNQRLTVYDSSGRLLGATSLKWPDLVAFGKNDETIYVVTRKVVDGYKAINEFQVLKLNRAIEGKVIAQVTLRGVNAPQMAVSATSPPAVWLSNVGNEGQKLVRIEDRGEELVVTDEVIVDADAGFVKVWADPLTDDVYVNNGWNRITRYNGLTGQSQKLREGAIDLAIGPDRNLYMIGRKGWKEPVYRCSLNLEPVPFAGTGTPTAAKEIYGRYGMGWSNKGLTVAPDGRIFVRHMYDWTKYHVLVFAPDGTLEQHNRVAGGIVGPVDGQTGGLRVDRKGNIYLSMAGHPTNWKLKARRFEGCVVKIPASGGGLVAEKGSAPGMAFAKHFFEGAVTAYPHLAPRQDPSGCVCKEARFDIDAFGRLYVPNVIDFCVRIYDNAGNLIHRFGRYGNADPPDRDDQDQNPTIPLGWPMTCGVNRYGRVYIADVLNHRVVRADLYYETETEIQIERQ